MKGALILAFLIAYAAGACTYNSTDCAFGCQCWSFEIVTVEILTDSSTNEAYTRTTWNVTNFCKWAPSYIAFGRSGLTVRSPEAGDTITTPEGAQMRVEYTDWSGNPGFPSVKFVFGNAEYWKNGYEGTIVIEWEGVIDPRQSFSFEAHGGQGQLMETFNGFRYSNCNPQECPLGFEGDECADCEDNLETPGYTWWCVPQDSDVNPFVLQRLQCTVSGGDCPADGFKPSVSHNGFETTCDCKYIEYPCPYNCSGYGWCNTSTGTCECFDETNPNNDCTPQSTTGPKPCAALDFCSNHGWCDGGACNCTAPYAGPSCADIPKDQCGDFESCDSCVASGLGCSWCTVSGLPACRQSTICQADSEDVPNSCTIAFAQRDPGVQETELPITTIATAAGISAGLIIGIVVGAIALVSIGAGAAYWKKYQNNKIDMVSNNPLYEETGQGANPLFEDKRTSALYPQNQQK